jgi:hypothetical protein
MMSNRKLTSQINGFFTAFGSAIAVASAIDNGRRPKARDLRTLGIDPEQFGRIGR